MRAASTEDRRYCRIVLPQVSRTFAISIRLLSGPMGEAVRIGYLLCRSADALEDSWRGDAGEIRARFAELVRAIDGDESAAQGLARRAAGVAQGRADLELVARLPSVLAVHGALPAPDREAIVECVRTMGAGMSHFAARAAARPPDGAYLDTEAELDEYCFAVAGCVGVMLTRMFAARAILGRPEAAARLLALAPRVGEALQLTNIVLDWPVDVRRGRCFVPASWLAEHGLRPRDLVGRDHPGVRALAARLESRARSALACVPGYLALVPLAAVRYRLFCLWPAVWAAGSLTHARRDPEFPWGARRPRLPRAVLWRRAIASLFLPPEAALRRA
ncbi:MAG TPA: squalene/phytoene synthase family protein [Candidatus Eisenbacteria bacterium]|jgi:farnesyl-diphosphate farnesyltransferase